MKAGQPSRWGEWLGWMALLGVALLGVLATRTPSSEARAQEEAQEEAQQQLERPLFIRVDKSNDGKPRALQTAVARYEIESGTYKGAKVDLVGAVHVGERSYYEELNRRFKEYEAVLYELVANSDDRPSGRQPRGGVNPIGSLQTGMKDALKLAFQLEEVNYQAKNFVHADMSPEEFGQDMVKRNDGFVSMFARLMGAGFATQSSKKNSQAQSDMMAAMLSRDPIRMRRAMANQMEVMDNQMVGLADKDGKSTLLTERNAKAFEVLQRELDSGRRSLSVFYGAAHLLDMHDRMTRDFGAKLTKIEWLDAWDLRSDAVKK